MIVVGSVSLIGTFFYCEYNCGEYDNYYWHLLNKSGLGTPFMLLVGTVRALPWYAVNRTKVFLKRGYTKMCFTAKGLSHLPLVGDIFAVGALT